MEYGKQAAVCAAVSELDQAAPEHRVFDWLPDWTEILAVLGGGLVLVLAFALGASLPLLRARPARTLRSL